MKVHPIPYASFETTKSRLIKILYCSVSWKNSSVFFLSQTFTLWTKGARWYEVFKLLSGWVNIHQIPYVIFETKSQFFFKTLDHSSLSWDITLWYFLAELYMMWTKGAHQRAKLQTFDCSRKISPNLYFDRPLLLKVCKILAKRVHRSYVSWPWRLIQNLKKNWLFQKWQEFGEIWPEYLKLLKICTFISSHCAKY